MNSKNESNDNNNLNNEDEKESSNQDENNEGLCDISESSERSSKFPNNSPQTKGQSEKLKAARELTDREREEFRDRANRTSNLITKSNLPSLQFGVWNINCDSLANNDKMKALIREVLIGMNCDIYALQESLWVPNNFEFRIFNERRNYDVIVRANSKNALIYYDKNALHFTNVNDSYFFVNDFNMNDRFSIGIFRLITNDENSILSKAFQESGLDSDTYHFSSYVHDYKEGKIRINSLDNSSTNRFIFISVHIPHRNYDDEGRLVIIEHFIRRAIILSNQNNNIPFIISGDFNVTLLKTEEYIKSKSEFSQIQFTRPEILYKGDKSVDFFIYRECSIGTENIFEFQETSYYFFTDASRQRLADINSRVSEIREFYQQKHMPIKCEMNFFNY